MKGFFVILVALASVCTISAFGGSEERFIKKYAMMKIYESCFGPDVVKQIRKEMKVACAKCAALENPPPPPMRPTPPQSLEPVIADHSGFPPQPQFDSDKLHQAILAYRPSSFQGASYRPFSPVSGYYPFNNGMFQPTAVLYPGFQNQFQNQYTPYNFPVLGQQFYGNNRMSREMDVRSQLEALTSRMSGKVKNVTCVMQELGYLDENLEPNYVKISERISNLPVSEELKRDMQDGVSFCQQFSQCVPEIKKDRSPLSRELIRPMFFFKCYKHKKLEACVMKDVREKYTGVSEEDEFDGDVEFRRQSKATKFTDNDENANELASSMYDFLYGADSNVDIDSIL